MYITDDIIYAGVNDHQVDLFEGQYQVPNGMAYNSYVIKDEKIAVMDTVDGKFTHEWLDNVEKALAGRKPDYLVVQHMEPDHSANIQNFMKAYPEAVIVANAKTFCMVGNFFRSMDLEGRTLEVKNGDSLSLGKHVLYRDRGQVWGTGAEPVKGGFRAGYPDHLPPARTGVKGKSGPLSGKIPYLVFLRGGGRRRGHRLYIRIWKYEKGG